MNEGDVHDRLWKPQVVLGLRAGRRACAGNYAVVHARLGVRTAGDIGRHNPDNRLSDLSEKTQTRSASPALQADIVLSPRPRLVGSHHVQLRPPVGADGRSELRKACSTCTSHWPGPGPRRSRSRSGE